MTRIGLTGGIGAGKTVVAERLRELGAVVVDADELARTVVGRGTPGLAAIRARFGSEVLRPDGTLDRSALAAVVFADPRALADLNAITHPRIAELAETRFAAAPPGAVLVYDMALLVENGLTRGWDLLVVVDAPDEVRIERLVRFRGLTEKDARARMAAQAPRTVRLAVADVIIDNGGTRAETLQQVNALWERISTSVR